MFLSEVSSALNTLPGLGPASVKALGTLGIHSIGRLIQHYPREYEDRKAYVSIKNSLSGTPASCTIHVVSQSWFGLKPRQTLKVHIEDSEGTPAVLVCFNRPFLKDKLKPGSRWYLYGTFKPSFSEVQSSLFDVEPLEEDGSAKTFGEILPIYPLAQGLHQATLRKALKEALKLWAENLEDDLPFDLVQKYKLLPLAKALKFIHFPEELKQADAARRTLVYREFFHLQLAVRRRAKLQQGLQRVPKPLPQEVKKELLARLPFRMTPDQDQVISEIEQDLAGPSPMARLVQGDVGSGKTLVAFLSALGLIQQGHQAALLAPTELLALQHAENAARYLDPIGVKIAFLSGNVKSGGRTALLKQLKEGKIDFVVGTHALFSADVEYKSLRYVIVDEQHRFGVEQRRALLSKGINPDLLLMSATPIPRTLAQTAFGDLEISVIKTMPPGRKPIETHLALQSNQKKVTDFIARELAGGRQAYFVYPLIEASEVMDLKDAQSAWEHLQTVFRDRKVAIIHSKIDEELKKATMEDFAAGKIDVLVATSVVEVGVDVPNATCMVIEHAERFGLSALHQLRGRVGRGTFQSYCFLVYSDKLTEEGKQRLLVMKNTSDGFKIAEEDLKIRGPGEMLGVRQSGYLKLSIADMEKDAKVLEVAQTDVKRILAEDPGLLLPVHLPLARLLAKAPVFSADLIATG
ncbi:MAG: ATP-dependent DNA helicase RecG [Spirochaetes bacterium GWB1_48_6]|nr:MAG: ATP-dependent DNA helicase RecG [Spirochaetes bacterium GWB1_48_6]